VNHYAIGSAVLTPVFLRLYFLMTTGQIQTQQAADEINRTETGFSREQRF
jgi:hypothetical protein